jgi:hypothetical protein
MYKCFDKNFGTKALAKKYGVGRAQIDRVINVFKITQYEVEKFESCIERIPFHTCWEYVGLTGRVSDKYRYARHRIGKSNYQINRVSYQIYKGQIPDGLYVCHTCDNNKCVNPAHLFLGTQKDNMEDMMKKKRGNHYRLLTKEQILEMRSKYIPKVYGMKRLAKEFGCSYTEVNLIINRKRHYKI